MRNRGTAILPLILLATTWLAAGCGDDSTGPDPDPPAPGAHVWSARFGDGANAQSGSAVGVDDAGNVIVAGSFSGSIDFGGGALVSAGGSDLFVAKFGPDGAHLWSRRFGDAAGQGEPALAVGASGGVVIAGSFAGTVDFGGGPLTSAGSGDAFVASFTSDGVHLWSRRFGDGSYQRAYAVGVDDSGNVVLAGSLLGAADFGGGTLTSAGNSDIFVAKFDAAGNHAWSRRVGDAGIQVATAIAADAAGNVVVAGAFEGAVDFGGGALVSAGLYDIFLAKFEPTGAHAWSRRFGDGNSQAEAVVAVTDPGGIFLAGSLVGTADFGGAPLTSAGNADAFVAAFASGGDHLWSARFGDAAYQGVVAIAADLADNIVLAGDLQGAADFGGGALTSAGGADLFIARFAPGGAHAWSRRFGDATDQGARGIAIGGTGHIAATGELEGTLDFGGGALAGAGAGDVYVVKFGL